jgi:putative peptidoglycan lipid II flippase
VVPSAIAFLAFGDVIAAALLQTGRFRREDAVYVWGILAGSAVGLLASTLARLYSSTYYALHDTRTPLTFAVVRISVGIVLGYFLAVHAPGAFGLPQIWGAAGLTVSASLAGWTELLLLRRSLNARIGRTGLPAPYVVTLWLLGIAGAAVGSGLRIVLPAMHPAIAAAAILGPYGIVYMAGAFLRGIPEAGALLNRVARRR